MLVHPGATIGEGFAPSPYSIVDEDVVIGAHVKIGSFVHVCKGVVLEDGVVIGDHVTICDGAHVGECCSVSDFAVIGKRPTLGPASTAKSGELDGVVLGDHCSVGSHTVLMAGSTFGAGCIIGDNAGVRERCTVGERAVIGRGVTVENDTAIGSRTKIQSGAYITAYVTIEEDVFIAPMVVTTNDNFMGRTQERFAHLRGCTIHRGARVGGGSHILPGIEIGEESFVATGSVVTRDVPPRMLVMGVPARPVREVRSEELLENQ
ncbi:MAG: N-acetyltransferase [Actinomycetia bacterium]|nr:N-acetyltransferase [Actinomycetes bacterium]